MSAGDPAFPRKPSYREVAEQAVGGRRADPKNVKRQLAASRAKRRMKEAETARIAALKQRQASDSGQ